MSGGITFSRPFSKHQRLIKHKTRMTSIFDALPPELVYSITDTLLAIDPFAYVRLAQVCKRFLRIVQEGTVEVYSNIGKWDAECGVRPLFHKHIKKKHCTTTQIGEYFHTRVKTAPEVPKLMVYRNGNHMGDACGWFNGVYRDLVLKHDAHAVVIRVMSVCDMDDDAVALQFIYQPDVISFHDSTKFIDHTVFETIDDEVDLIERFNEVLGIEYPPIFDHHYHFYLGDVAVLNPKWMFRKKPNTRRSRIGLTCPGFKYLDALTVVEYGQRGPVKRLEDKITALFYSFNLPNLESISMLHPLPSLLPLERFPLLELVTGDGDRSKFFDLDIKTSESLKELIGLQVDLTRPAVLPALRTMALYDSIGYGIHAPRLSSVALHLWDDFPDLSDSMFDFPNLERLYIDLGGELNILGKIGRKFSPVTLQNLRRLTINLDSAVSTDGYGFLNEFFLGRKFDNLEILFLQDERNDEDEGHGFVVPPQRTLDTPRLEDLYVKGCKYLVPYFINECNKEVLAGLDFLLVYFLRSKVDSDAIRRSYMEFCPKLTRETCDVSSAGNYVDG